ncbi:MAG: spore coat protein [Eubacterium sp.]|nr:spore coat protein [Eubacterium sp.]
MDDKNLMQDILLLEKGVCDLYMHGAIESSTQNINQTFKNALNESLCMQDDIYKKMQEKGWYQTDTAQQDKINTLKQKFTNMQA